MTTGRVSETSYIGQPVHRVDGFEKVTGKARYAGEYNFPGLLHGVVVSSSISRGKIKTMDTSAALAVEGVKNVYSHLNVKGLPWFDITYKDMNMLPGSPFRPFYSDEIQFSQQPVALVIAETLELARYAATLVKIIYDVYDFDTNLEANIEKGFKPTRGKAGFDKPKSRGNAQRAR